MIRDYLPRLIAIAAMYLTAFLSALSLIRGNYGLAIYLLNLLMWATIILSIYLNRPRNSKN